MPKIQKDYSISMEEANVFGLKILLPVTATCFLIYSLVWGFQTFYHDFADTFFNSHSLWQRALYFLLIFAIGVCLHEIIHLVTWKIATGKPWRSFAFGIDRATYSPYTHCREPMDVNAYRIGGILPGILTGLLPFLWGTMSHRFGWAFIGYLFLTAAAGDWLVLWLLRDVKHPAQVEDHPTRAGCMVLEDEEEPPSN